MWGIKEETVERVDTYKYFGVVVYFLIYFFFFL